MSKNLSAKLIHTGDGQYQKKLNKAQTVPETFPVYLTSVFAFDDVLSVDNIYEKKSDGYIYSRIAAPNSDAVCEILKAADGAAGAAVFSSGMAAITSSVLAFAQSGDHIISAPVVYGGVNTFFSKEIGRLGIEVDFVDFAKEDFSKYIKPNTKIVYAETISNPLMEVPDIPAISKIARKNGLLLIIDNTFATPAVCEPLSLGADIAVYSATKYLGGHSDIIGGAACLKSPEIAAKLKEKQVIYGNVLGAMDCWLLARSLRTLDLRMKKHCANALKVADFLNAHPKIEKVFFPGIKSSPYYKSAKSQFNDGLFGAMMSINLKGGAKAAVSLINKLEEIFFVPSLAGTPTTVSYSAKTSHRFYKKEDRERLGIGDNQVRLSVGLEDSDYIIDQLSKALK